jgi:DNA-binding beta-propeller fold protein YncE
MKRRSLNWILKVHFTILVSVLFINCEIADYPYFLKRTGNDHGMLWVSNSADNTVTCIDRYTDNEIGTYDVGPNPSRTAVDLDGNCWVGSRGDDTVYFVTTDGETKKYEGFNAARGVALDKDGNVWIANSGNNTIQKIDIETDEVSEQLSLGTGSYFYGALIDSDGYLWIADQGASTMIRYDTSKFPDDDAFETIVVNGLYGFTIDPEGYLWAAGLSNPVLTKIDTEKAEIEEEYTIPSDIFGGMVCAVSFDSNGNIWITNDSTNSVIRFNPDEEDFEDFEISGSWPHGLGAGDDTFIYTINGSSNNISKIDINTGEEVEVIEVGTGPYTYSDLTGFIYRHVTLKKDNRILKLIRNIRSRVF